MNSCTSLLVFVALVCGKVCGGSLCPAGHVMDWESKSCWSLKSMISDIKNCKATLPKLQIDVQAMQGTLGEMELNMRQLQEEHNARLFELNESSRITNQPGDSTVYRLEENPNNHILKHSEQQELNERNSDLNKEESSRHYAHLSVAETLTDENSHTFTLSDQNELDQQPITQTETGKNDWGKEHKTPIFEFSGLTEKVNTENVFDEGVVDEIEKNPNTLSFEPSKQTELDEELNFKSTEKKSSEQQSEKNRNSYIPKYSEIDDINEQVDTSNEYKLRIRQLEYDIELQKEKNEACAAKVATLEDGLTSCAQLAEREKKLATAEIELLITVSTLQEQGLSLLTEENQELTIRCGDLEDNEHHSKESCQELVEQTVEEEISKIKEEFNEQFLNSIAEREEIIKEQQEIIKMKQEKIHRQNRVIKFLHSEISKFTYGSYNDEMDYMEEEE